MQTTTFLLVLTSLLDCNIFLFVLLCYYHAFRKPQHSYWSYCTAVLEAYGKLWTGDNRTKTGDKRDRKHPRDNRPESLVSVCPCVRPSLLPQLIHFRAAEKGQSRPEVPLHTKSFGAKMEQESINPRLIMGAVRSFQGAGEIGHFCLCFYVLVLSLSM